MNLLAFISCSVCSFSFTPSTHLVFIFPCLTSAHKLEDTFWRLTCDLQEVAFSEERNSSVFRRQTLWEVLWKDLSISFNNLYSEAVDTGSGQTHARRLTFDGGQRWGHRWFMGRLNAGRVQRIDWGSLAFKHLFCFFLRLNFSTPLNGSLPSEKLEH